MKARTISGFIIAYLIITMAGCDYCFLNESIYGDGNVVSVKRKVPGFDGIRVSTGIDVFIKQGASEALKLEADENLHEVIKTEVRNGTLNIYSEVNIRRAKSKKVYVIYKDLNRLRISSAGDITGVNTLKTDELEISLSSAGDLDLDVEAREIDISISSSGDARITGSADYLKADLSSAGDLNAFDLKTRKCRINVSSAGNAKINVSEELNATASSAGDIYYKGNPEYKNLNSSSAGGIHRY